VALASGYGHELASERFSAADVAAFVSKPYEPEALVAALGAAIARSAPRRTGRGLAPTHMSV
jgi:hypothetical protein